MRMRNISHGNPYVSRDDLSDSTILRFEGLTFRCEKCHRQVNGLVSSGRVTRMAELTGGYAKAVSDIVLAAAPNCDCDRSRCRIAPKVQRKYRGRFSDARMVAL
jgi:hypothetical protein